LLIGLLFVASLQFASIDNSPVLIPTENMITERADHSATLLIDGKVLITGGVNDKGFLSSAEVFDPVTRSFTPTGDMNSARSDHATRLLFNGNVLITGGRNGLGVLGSAEIWNPDTGKFTRIGEMTAPRAGHTSTLLSSGKVLLIGGDGNGSAEIFDPSTNAFLQLDSKLSTPRSDHTATVLEDDRVLIVGGSNQGEPLSTIEVYDPGTQSFSLLSGGLHSARSSHAALRLAQGNVLLIGGDQENTIELFNPKDSTCAVVGNVKPDSTGPSDGRGNLVLSRDVRRAIAATLYGEKILLIGGDIIGLLNLETGEVKPVADSELAQRVGHTATALLSGDKVLVAGGKDKGGNIINEAALLSDSTDPSGNLGTAFISNVTSPT
jgi:hypothetical protein